VPLVSVALVAEPSGTIAIPPTVALSPGLVVSLAVIDCTPASVNVTANWALPASASWNV